MAETEDRELNKPKTIIITTVTTAIIGIANNSLEQSKLYHNLLTIFAPLIGLATGAGVEAIRSYIIIRQAFARLDKMIAEEERELNSGNLRGDRKRQCQERLD